VPQATLDQYTVLVKPWWLYRDYRAAQPAQLWDKSWAKSVPGFQPSPQLLVEPNGSQTTQIRVCMEETQVSETGHVYASGRTSQPAVTDDAGAKYAYDRATPVPVDDGFATRSAGQEISCRTQTGAAHALDCGCGVGLEHCWPQSSGQDQAPALMMVQNDVLGADAPLDDTAQSTSAWQRLWWGEEARHFLMYLFGDDHDFREILSAPYTWVNGPLVQYYKSEQPAGCCGQGVSFGFNAPDPLVDPNALPVDLLPHDATQWELVQNRGAHASGILTMPIFLTKFGTRRSRAHVLYNAFLCKDFIAPPNLQLTPSSDPNLMTRSGCNACHATLEPMAAYFTRIVESDFTYLPAEKFPTTTAGRCGGSGAQPPYCACKNNSAGVMPNVCQTFFDPAFSDATHAVMRGAYPDVVNGSSTNHADLGPAGIATELAQNPEFAGCVAQNVASSFLGRPLTADDDALRQALAATLTGGSYKMRALVAAVVRSDAYRKSNNMSSAAWRAAQAGAQ
jgi:hypothetical protein